MSTISVIHATLFALTSFINYPRIGQNHQPIDYIETAFKQPQAPPPKDAPNGRSGIRSACNAITLTPIIPKNQWGLTLRESPTVWIAVSYESEKLPLISAREFSLLDRYTNKKLPPRRISIKDMPEKSGAFGISIPQKLEVDKWYRWVFSIKYTCPAKNGKERPETQPLEIEGFIYRFGSYDQQKIWYDSLDQAARLYCQKNSQEEWSSLLSNEAVKLDKLSKNFPVCPN